MRKINVLEFVSIHEPYIVSLPPTKLGGHLWTLLTLACEAKERTAKNWFIPVNQIPPILL